MVYPASIDPEEAYDIVNREVLWQALKIYGMRETVLASIKSSLSVADRVSEWFGM